MVKLLLFGCLLFCSGKGYSQGNFIVLKKRQKSIQYFWKDSHITFQLQDGQWLTGIITKITRDSFYLTQEIIRYYPIGTDTLHISGLAVALKDIEALPTKKERIVYAQGNVNIILGHEKFVWFRNGLLFQLAGAGYVVLNIANHFIQKDPPFAKKNLAGLGIGTAAFLIGEILHRRFNPYWPIGKKYYLECVVLQEATPNNKKKAF